MSMGFDRSNVLERPSKAHTVVRIHLLGPMRATTCFGDDVLPCSKRARGVLGYLCLTPGGRVSRRRLASLFWDRMPEAAAQSHLLRTLGEVSAAFDAFAHELISIAPDDIKLNVDACWIDAQAALALESNTAGSVGGALQVLCGGELLGGLDGLSPAFDQWLLAERGRVTARMKIACERGRKRATAESDPFAGSAFNKQSTLGEVLRRRPQAPSKSGRDRLRVGVLSFAANGSETDENLAFALSSEITAALGRFRWFDVIAAMSLAPPLSMNAVGEHELRRMDLDYLVDWTVSGNAQGTEISVRLLDFGENARPIWSKRLDLAYGGPQQLNELVATRIAGCIDPVIPFIEGQPKLNHRHGATGFLRRAVPLMFSMERGKYQQAGRLINQALEIDPDNSEALALAAHWHHFNIGQGWAAHTKEAFVGVQNYALRAIRLDPDNVGALGIYAHYCSLVDRDFDAALGYFDRSLRLNPSLAFIWGLSASTQCYIGEPEAALERLERYRELAPFDAHISWFELLYTLAYLFKKDYERAVTVGRRAVETLPDFVNAYKPFIAALGHLGRREEARPYVERLLRLEPKFTVENFGEVYPIKKTSDRKRYMEGLRLAGIPER
jgi:tetratricopeptide (TPR) repeat protein